jgi:hypothetical protein
MVQAAVSAVTNDISEKHCGRQAIRSAMFSVSWRRGGQLSTAIVMHGFAVG